MPGPIPGVIHQDMGLLPFFSLTGKYSIVQKDGSGTHLVWKTEVPSEPGKVQEELGIGHGGSLAISIKVSPTPPPFIAIVELLLGVPKL